jgi:hypothetical protein
VKVIAVDCGTWNSQGSIMDDALGEKPVMVTGQVSPDVDGKTKQFPSFVSFQPDGSVENVGLDAKEKLVTDPLSVAWGLKRLVGKTYKEAKAQGELGRFSYLIEPDPETGRCLVVMGGRKYRPEEVIAEILRTIKVAAERKACSNLDDVVVSIPAYFDAIHATSLVQAAKLAGFRSVKTIPEPVAALLAYDVPITPKPLKVLVFDLGAGTLDVTVGNLIRKGPAASDIFFQSKKTSGNTHLGGIDMDDRMVGMLLEKAGLKAKEIQPVDMIRLRREAEKAKIRLSREVKTMAAFKACDAFHTLEVSRSDLDNALRGKNGEIDIIEECRDQVVEALSGAFWTPEDIDQLLLVGGPSCMPCMTDMLAQVFKKNSRVIMQLDQFKKGDMPVDPMDAVAKGAALSTMSQKIIPHPYGYGFVEIDLSDPDKIIERPQMLVPPGSVYPCMSEPFWITWYHKGATTPIEIIQEFRNEGGIEYRHMGFVDIALKAGFSLFGSGTQISMGLNENEELIISLRESLSGKEIRYVGAGHMKRIPVKLPRQITRINLPKEKGDERWEVDESAVGELVKWAQAVLRLCQARIADPTTDRSIVNELKPYVNALSETFRFYVYDEAGVPSTGRAVEHWNDIINSADPLLHRAIELGAVDSKRVPELKGEGDRIKSRIIKITVK